ncbi:MAG: DNA-binding transcriptional regulator, MarR family [Candidatus Doudnabacteria bacterium]|nr:DNA-binding transcriptional regulator, MarR family [Candidatus Doudnabacteria bacterium]
MTNKLKEQVQRFFEAMTSLHQAMGGRRHNFIKRFGLTHQQVEILYALGDRRILTVKEIAATMGVTSSAATQMVEGLQKIGILQRQTDPDDRRMVKVSLTVKGLKKFEEFKQAHAKHMEFILKALSNDERELLISLPDKMIKQLKKNNAKLN